MDTCMISLKKMQSRSYSDEKAKEDISQLLYNGFGEDKADISSYIHSRLARIGLETILSMQNDVCRITQAACYQL